MRGGCFQKVGGKLSQEKICNFFQRQEIYLLSSIILKNILKDYRHRQHGSNYSIAVTYKALYIMGSLRNDHKSQNKQESTLIHIEMQILLFNKEHKFLFALKKKKKNLAYKFDVLDKA